MWSDVDRDKMPGPRLLRAMWDPRQRGHARCGHGVIPEKGWAGTHEAHDPGSGGLLTGGLGTRGSVEAHACSCKFGRARMTRGKQKIEAQKRSAERNEKPKGSQIEARNAGLKTVCSVCKASLANYKQLVDHFGSKHPKETVPPGPSS